MSLTRLEIPLLLHVLTGGTGRRSDYPFTVIFEEGLSLIYNRNILIFRLESLNEKSYLVSVYLVTYTGQKRNYD